MQSLTDRISASLASVFVAEARPRRAGFGGVPRPKPRRAPAHRSRVTHRPTDVLWALVLAGGDGTRLRELTRLISGAPNPKSELLAAIGARYFSAQETPIERLAEQIGNIDLVYEATGASSIAFQMMEAIGTNGVFVFTGVPGRKAPIEVDTDVIMRNLVLKNQAVFGTVNAGHEAFEAAVRDLTVFAQRWPAAVRALITGRYPVEAYRDLLVGPPQGIKNVLTFA